MLQLPQGHVILLESVDSRELKIIGGGMYGILETRMGAELDKRRILKYGEVMGRSGLGQSFEDEIMLDGLHSSVQTQEREQLGDASIEIKGIFQGSKKLKHMLQSVFMNKKSEIENQPLYDRFVIVEGMHVVPPPMIGNYMPLGPDVEVDDSKFTYGPKQTQPNESETQSSEIDTCESNISAEPSELVSEPVVNESNVKSTSLSDALSLRIKTPRENVKNQSTHSQKPKVDKKDLGYGFAVRACFVCGSLNHLIRDCNFHEKRIERNADLNNGWNNVQRVNKQNQFVPSAGKVLRSTVLKSTAMKVNTVKPIVNRVRPANVFYKTHSSSSRPFKKTTVLRTDFSNQKLNTAKDYPHRALKNKGIVDSGCSRHMTGNKAYLAEFQDFNGGPVAFGGSKGYITGKGKIKTGKLDFEDVCFVKELQHFNLFSVSQMCDKKNKVLFTDSECLVLSSEFKLPDENQVLLKIPRQNNMYSFNLENIVPSGGLACLIAKATTDESNKWHRRLGHVNFKNLNKLVKGNLVREETIDVGDSDKEDDSTQDCFVLPIWPSYSSTNTPAVTTDDKRVGLREEEQVFMDDLERLKWQEKEANEEAEVLRKKFEHLVIK
ncbi:ribonuclease H-like domain-containing protein [Tanacetum coccineum]